MTHRCLASVAVLLVVLAALDLRPGSGLAQEGLPAATPLGPSPAVVRELDLAAMALLPPDLEALGISGYGVDVGSLLTLDEQAERVAPDLGQNSTEVASGLDAAGFRRRYELQLGLPQQLGETPTRLQAFIASYILEYATAAGATAGFSLLEHEAAAGMHDVPEARVFGDRSEVTRLQALPLSNQPYQALDLTFQVGNLVAGVTLAELTGQEPTLMTIEALGERLLAKVQAGQTAAGPGLSNRILRLGGQGFEFRADEYGRIGGEMVPGYNETAAELAERASRYGEAIDVYGVWLSLPGGPSPQADVYYSSLLHRFADAEVARAWLGEERDPAAIGPNIIAAISVPGAATIGEESRTLRLTIQRNRGETSEGYLIFTRVGAEVVRVQVVGTQGLPLSAVETLARAQLACLQSGTCPERARVPVELSRLATPGPGSPDASLREAASAAATPGASLGAHGE
jgi:hypothetical protein